MGTTTMIHVRVEDDVKVQATEALAAMGLTVSDAVRLLLRRVVAEQALPLELKVPNTQTRAAIKESRALAKKGQKGRARLQNAQAAFDELETRERP